jgi:mannose-6-phosphate isomerase-like protein (cupin superfamily)
MVDDNILNKLNKIKVELTESEVLDKLLDRMRWPKNYISGQPSVEAIIENGEKHQDFFDEDGYINSAKVISCYEDGYSLILSNIGGLNRSTFLIQEVLNDHFQKRINCNFYFGNGLKSTSFKKHKHDYPVIVKNVYGTSKWVIDEKEVILSEQDVIWFDKNTDHEVIEISSAKLSITCNIE